MKRFFAVFGIIMLIAGFASAGEKPPSYFPVSELKPGMKAVGRTIFQGGKAEEFGVEILGVLQGIPNPKRSLIIIRLSGVAAERTGVFAGMSGSPVFIDGRLLGAVAYAFPFSKEPIGAITPIEDTFSVLKTGGDESSDDRPSVAVSFKDLVAASYAPKLDSSLLQPGYGLLKPITVGPQAASVPGLSQLVGQTLMPISAPLGFSGIDPAAMQYFAGHFQAMGLLPVAAPVGGSSTGETLAAVRPDSLAPGKTLAVELTRGDYRLAAVGTVTWREGNKVYAFGHPLFSLGSTALPMSEAEVVTVVPSVMNSFKLATGGELMGTITQDRAAGIYGEIGVKPKMIPLKINMRNSRGNKETINLEVASDKFLTPLLVQISTLNSIIGAERGMGDLTLNIEGKINVKGQPQISFSNRFSSQNALISTVIYAGYPFFALYYSGFNIDLENIELNITASDLRSAGSLTRLAVDRTEAKRGETVMIQAFARNDRGEIYQEKIPISIPEDAPYGKLNITLGDGGVMAALDRRALIDSNPKDLSALVKAINKLPRNDKLYLKLYGTDSGAIINNEEMPSLPPSMIAALDSTRTTGGYMPLPIATVLNKELLPAKFLINGQQTITIKIVP